MSIRARSRMLPASLIACGLLALPGEVAAAGDRDLIETHPALVTMLSRLGSVVHVALTCDDSADLPGGCAAASALAIPVVGPVVAAAETRGAEQGLAVGLAIAEGAALTLATFAWVTDGEPGHAAHDGVELRLALRPTGVALIGRY